MRRILAANYLSILTSSMSELSHFVSVTAALKHPWEAMDQRGIMSTALLL